MKALNIGASSPHVGWPARWQQAPVWAKALFLTVLFLKVFLCFFTGHFDIYRFLVFLQHALAFPHEDPWAYRALNEHSDFPYPPALFYVLRWLVSLGDINPIPPHEPPAGHLYSLIKSPIFVADLLVALWLTRRTSFKWMLLTYWCSSVVIFHQFYSGQYDLFVAAPLVFVFCLQDRRQKVEPVSGWGGLAEFVLWLASVLLKPFALLFAPFLVLQQQGWRRRALAGLTILCVFILFKASEWPHSGSSAYREQMGAGVHFLVMNLKMHKQYWFVATCFFLLAYIQWRAVRHSWWAVACVTLGIGAFAFHSAGWMTWAAVTLPVVLHDQGRSRAQLVVFAVWQLTFLLKWAYCPTSPLFDSLSVFTDRFMHWDLRLPMGYVYAQQPTIFGKDSFLLFGRAFAIASFVLLFSLLAKSRKAPAGRSIAC